MAGNLCVSIGVSRYTPGLEPLPGAVRAAEDFASWAQKAGYNCIIITDLGEQTVTIQRIREAMESALSQTEIRRLVFYFAGHGTAVAAANECWLLSNVLHEPEEAIDRVAFQRQLATYRIPQIAFFADACRTVTALSFEVNGRGVLPNSGAERIHPQFDIFLACSLGHPALSVRGGVNSHDRCLFTEVLLNGLSGNAEKAIEKDHHPQAPAVVSHTLANFVESEAENEASLLNRINRPEIQAAFRAPEDVYLKITGAQQSAGAPQPVAPSGAPVFPAPAFDERDIARLRRQRRDQDELTAQDALDRVLPDFLRWIDIQREHPFGRELRYMLEEVLYANSGAVAWSSPPIAVAVPKSQDYRRLIHPPFPMLFPLSGMQFDPHIRSTMMFVISENGDWSPVPVFPGLLAIVTLSATGLRAISYLSRESLEGNGVVDDYKEVLGPLSSGQLQSSDANRIADRVRRLKHVNPLFGVIAGYLYAASGDVDNIVRMASYYFQEAQPVPFDLALLSASRLRWVEDREGGFRVSADFRKVPAARKDRHAKRERPYFAQQPFPERKDVAVSGFMPWLRQGWALLASDTGLGVPGIMKEISGELRASPFTSISGEAGRALSDALRYETIPRDLLNRY